MDIRRDRSMPQSRIRESGTGRMESAYYSKTLVRVSTSTTYLVIVNVRERNRVILTPRSTTQDDKRRRLRAFLTCMRSDVQLLLNPEFVPQQLLVAAVVLRYVLGVGVGVARYARVC